MESANKTCPPVLQTGFRIFFLGAAVYAVVSMIFWMVFYVLEKNIFVAMPLTVWHGHEMVFGFTMAVVAGFLLTAVMNWTGVQTLHGKPLLALFLAWAAARFFAFMPATFPLWPMVLCDTAFIIGLTIAVMKPIIQVKQWKQSAIFSKLFLLLITGTIFYIALYHEDLLAQRKSLRFAIYMMISLILTIGRRIMPFFTERGVGYPVTLRNNRTVDIASLVLLVAFSIMDVFWPQRWVVAGLSASLAIVHIIRLAGWHTHGIWKKPLLWILFIGYAFIISGFVLKVFAAITQQPDDSALHAFTAGGIGLFTIGMMARVSWGHTGRNIAEAPRQLPFIFVPIVAGAFIRVFFPIISEPHYVLWIAVSQVLWIIAFVAYLVYYFKVLVSPRADERWG